MYVQNSSAQDATIRAKFLATEYRPVLLTLSADAMVMLSVAEAQQLIDVLTAALTEAEGKAA